MSLLFSLACASDTSFSGDWIAVTEDGAVWSCPAPYYTTGSVAHLRIASTFDGRRVAVLDGTMTAPSSPSATMILVAPEGDDPARWIVERTSLQPELSVTLAGDELKGSYACAEGEGTFTATRAGSLPPQAETDVEGTWLAQGLSGQWSGHGIAHMDVSDDGIARLGPLDGNYAVAAGFQGERFIGRSDATNEMADFSFTPPTAAGVLGTTDETKIQLWRLDADMELR